MSVVEKCIEKLSKGELIDEATVLDIVQKVKEGYLVEPNVVPIRSPVTVAGNIHGQLSDLFELFEVCGPCPETNYLFIGDMGDYGYWGIETVLLLFSLRVKYPSRITLLRGEHESRAMTLMYGLRDECLRKYGNERVWAALTLAFDCLPLAAVIDNTIFVAHGGISKEAKKIDNIRVLNRFQEIPNTGAMAELIWSDPDDDPPKRQGPGILYGQALVNEFVTTNKITHIVRGHKLCPYGFNRSHNGITVTVWSAPNFLGSCGNAGAALEISEHAPILTAAARPASAGLKTRLNNRDGKFFFNTFLAAPDPVRLQPYPNAYDELPRGIPEYFK